MPLSIAGQQMSLKDRVWLQMEEIKEKYWKEESLKYFAVSDDWTWTYWQRSAPVEFLILSSEGNAPCIVPSLSPVTISADVTAKRGITVHFIYFKSYGVTDIFTAKQT